MTIPEQPGSLRRFCTEAVGDHNITEFNYRMAGRDAAHKKIADLFASGQGLPEGERQAFRFHHVSTDEVYGSLELDDERLFTESTPIFPNMPYAAAKAGGDIMCNAYFVTHKVPVVVTHCSNNYGPYQFPEKLIPFFIFKLLKGEKVPVYGDGLNVRDWIHVSDHASALDLLLHDGVAGEIYNIGSDNERSNIEITKLMLKINEFFSGKPLTFR